MKNPGIAAVLSFLVVGLGQLYAGKVGRGLLFFFGAVVLGALSMLTGFFFILFLPYWVWNIYDAFKQAEKANMAA